MKTELFYQISKILYIPYSIFEWPNILVNLIIPFAVFCYALKCILDRLRIFGSAYRRTTLHWVIGFVVSFSLISLLSTISFVIIPTSLFIIGWIKIGRRGRLGWIIGISVIGLVLWFLLSGFLS